MSDQTNRNETTPPGNGCGPRKNAKTNPQVRDGSDTEARLLEFLSASEPDSMALSQLLSSGQPPQPRFRIARVQHANPIPLTAPEASPGLAAHIASIAEDIKRIADHLVPPPSAYMDSVELAKRLGGCSTTWVAKMARDGRIPKSCIVVGTGGSKLWKFHRAPIEKWLAAR